jgi:hypothetical protein
MSGGAGFIISKPTYSLIKDFINKSCISYIQKKYYEQLYGDVSFGVWVKLINEKLHTQKKEPITLVSTDKLNPYTHNNDSQLKECASFHYVTNKEQFEYYNKYNDGSNCNGYNEQFFYHFTYIITKLLDVFSMIIQKLFYMVIYKPSSLPNT